MVVVVLLLLTSVACTGTDHGERVGQNAGFSPGGHLHNLSPSELRADFAAVRDSGATWVRVDFSWSRVEQEEGVYDWADLERVVATAVDHDLRVLALLTYSPEWARPECDTDKCPPEDPEPFAAFAAAAARHFSPDDVQAWEIWNEPNISAFWSPEPDVNRYAELLTKTVDAVREANSDAFVVSAGLSPAYSDGVDIAPLDFVEALYELDAMDGVDAVGIHPYSSTSLPLAEGTEEWNTFLQMQELHVLMAEHGDGDKQVWATEFGVATGEDRRATTEERQTEIVEQGFQHFADGTWPWLGMMFAYSVRDTADDPEDWQSGFGLLRHDGTPKPAYDALRRVLEQPAVPPSGPPTQDR